MAAATMPMRRPLKDAFVACGGRVKRMVEPRGRCGRTSPISFGTREATDARSAPSTPACTSMVRAMLKWVMFVGPRTCDTLATLESNSGRRVFAAVGKRYDPDEVKRTVPLLKGVVSRAWIESTRTCGVWTATGYCTPVFGSIQKFGAVCELDDSETSRTLATSRTVSPTPAAEGRRTSPRNLAVVHT